MYECSSVIKIQVEKAQQVFNESTGEEEKKLKLQHFLKPQICERLSSFVGRGALDFNSEESSLTEHIESPKICLTGQLDIQKFNLNYVFNSENPEDLSMMNWAQFHNGVATALKISNQSL